MAKRQPSLLRSIFVNIWMGVCVIATASCIVLAVQLMLRLPPFEEGLPVLRLALGVPASFGALAGVYGIVMTVLLAVRGRRIDRLGTRIRAMRRRADHLEAQQYRQRQRIDELSTLRELATVVNYESDFTIIAERALEFIDGLLEPMEAIIFMMDDEKPQLLPFAQYREGKVLSGRKVQTRSIPDFELSDFQSHSVICRVHGQELHAIIPLKVEDDVQGVLFLVFPTDSRSGAEQVAEFNNRRRPVLIEMAHHISIAVKTKHLHTKAVVDSLTKLFTRSQFDSQLQASVEFAKRTGEGFSLILMDIDYFKKVNDTYGHATGDVVLQRVAKRVRTGLRKYDTAYRYGGEELAALLPKTAMRQAQAIAERLREAVGSQRIRAADGQLIGTTISLGVAQFKGEDDADSIFKRADSRLYRAKSQGRNQVFPAAA